MFKSAILAGVTAVAVQANEGFMKSYGRRVILDSPEPAEPRRQPEAYARSYSATDRAYGQGPVRGLGDAQAYGRSYSVNARAYGAPNGASRAVADQGFGRVLRLGGQGLG